MSDDLVRLLEAQGGAGSVRQLLATGASRRVVDELVRRKVLLRVRQDAVVLQSALTSSTAWERRALSARAVGHSLAPGGSGVHALSHQSALMIDDLPYLGEDDLVHLVRTDEHRGRRDRTVFVHGPVPEEVVDEVDGIRSVWACLASLQVAGRAGPEAGIVCMDGVLRRAEDEDVRAVGRRHGPSRDMFRQQVERLLELSIVVSSGSVATVLDLADGRSQSVGESRARWLVHLLGFGRATPQFEVRDGSTLYGVVDLKLEDFDVILEFDGTTKYSGPADLLAEKRREDQIRELGYEVVRLTWADLAHPRVVRRKILAAIARSQARSRVG